ncbi:MAG: histidine phosphatase family protein [Burkholderiales bacterium PBB4]|nr:MAG: histidine phosphatase family protein [Burkholderiales bacterium PBB4]
MQATRIIAIRHGETAWNAGLRLQGHTDIGLNAMGQWQAERVARALADESIDAVYSSDLSRAHATAQAVATYNTGLTEKTVTTHTGLRERGFGSFEGQTYAQIAQDWPEESERWRTRDPHFAPPGGESLVQLRARIQRTVDELASRHMGEHIVLVAHGGVMDALYRLATQLDLSAPRSWALGNATINRLLWTPDGLTLVGWADDQHLADTSSAPSAETATV